MLYIAQNLRLLRKQKQISQAVLAKQIGVVPGTISNYENGTSKPDFEQLERIIKFLDIPAHDLLYTDLEDERGIKTKTPKNVVNQNDDKNDDIFDDKRKLQKTSSNDEEDFKTKTPKNFTLSKGEKNGEKKGEKRKLQKTSPFNEGDFEGLQEARPVVYDMPEGVVENAVAVPVLPVEAAAGAGAFNLDFNEEVETMVLPRSFLTPTTSMRYCIDVRGESMEPTLLDRTRIVIRLLDRSNWGDVRNGKVYVITDREGLTYVKRVQNRLKTRGALVLISDNPDRDRFRSFELREEEIQHIWTVELYIADHIPPVAQRWDGMRDELDALRDRLDEMELMMK